MNPSNAGLSYTENFLFMLDQLSNPDYKPHPRLARALDVLFILHAEHELNCSTAGMRHLASRSVPYMVDEEYQMDPYLRLPVM